MNIVILLEIRKLGKNPDVIIPAPEKRKVMLILKKISQSET